MRPAFPKLRLHSLLALIAAIALPLGAERTWRRRAAYRARAAEQSALEEGSQWTGRACRANVVGLRERGREALARGDERTALAYFENATAFVPEAAHQDRLNAYHAALRAKYERAARHPWLPAAPDPPPPE